MLMSAGVPLYRHLNVHGYWIAGDAKMSKSLGNVVDPMAVPEQYGMDAFRYFLLREMQFGADASFTEEALVGRFNADLANDLGNLFSRVLSMAARYHASRSPACGPLEEADLALRDLAADAVGNFVGLFDAMQPAQALSSLWELVRALNRYVDSQAPWSLAKAGNAARLDTVMYCLLEGMYKTACCLWPIMPDTAAAMLRQLGMPGDRAVPPLSDLAQEAQRWGAVRPGLTLAASSNLFPRRESSDRRPAAALPAQPAAALPVEPEQRPPYADFADFQKLDLRVGRILEAQRHPNADKLLKLAVDLGEETPRQIISGLAGHFAPQDLPGRMTCVVANLAPRVIRGLESQGMILTAESNGKLCLLAPAGDAPPGSRIT
jgi:methionyl-tRNA synthetase